MKISFGSKNIYTKSKCGKVKLTLSINKDLIKKVKQKDWNLSGMFEQVLKECLKGEE